MPDKAKDEQIAIHVLNEHNTDAQSMLIPRDLFRKYVAYAKQRVHPELSKEAVEELKTFYVELRNKPVSSESAMRPIPISARQLQALIRMSEASAKLRLSKTVSKEDAKQAIEIMKYYLMQVGYDYESKQFDIDRISTGIPTSQRAKIVTVRETITHLEGRLGSLIPVEELEKELEDKMSKTEIDEAISKLQASGDIFKPKRGYVQRT
jgi:replicative DNA helicase Mcm